MRIPAHAQKALKRFSTGSAPLSARNRDEMLTLFFVSMLSVPKKIEFPVQRWTAGCFFSLHMHVAYQSLVWLVWRVPILMGATPLLCLLCAHFQLLSIERAVLPSKLAFIGGVVSLPLVLLLAIKTLPVLLLLILVACPCVEILNEYAFCGLIVTPRVSRTSSSCLNDEPPFGYLKVGYSAATPPVSYSSVLPRTGSRDAERAVEARSPRSGQR